MISLDVADVAVSPEGLRLTIRQSKTDQQGAGQVVGIGRTGSATCPLAAYEDWLAAANVTSGRVLRSVSRDGAVGDRLSSVARSAR